jgi:hemolysin III
MSLQPLRCAIGTGAASVDSDHMDRITLGRMQNPVRGFLHGSAAVAALVGLVFLLQRSWGDAAAVTGSLLYGLALIAMFTVSSLYHSIPWSPEKKMRLQRVDHSMIYLMVAGTFTPIAIAALEGWRLAVALLLVWVPGITGIILKAALPRVATWLSVTLQLSMGWAALVWAPQIHASLGMGAIVFIALGGACYTIGAIIFLTKKPSLLPRSFSYHELFHVLVVTASVLHFIAVFAYAVPVTVAS